jgi:NAD(P) transhydrogenase subunit alpha
VPGHWEEALYVFLLASFLGLEVIRRVPPLLHTPLMSLTNAISGIALVGSLVIAGAQHSTLAMWLGLVAVTASSINVVGGFLITDRMLRMFRRRPARRADGAGAAPGRGDDARTAAGS